VTVDFIPCEQRHGMDKSPKLFCFVAQLKDPNFMKAGKEQ